MSLSEMNHLVITCSYVSEEWVEARGQSRHLSVLIVISSNE